MSRFLFATMPATGHVAPRTAADLLEQLAQSGAPVTRPVGQRELAEVGR